MRAAASSCKCTFMALSCAQLYSPYVGDAERKIREVRGKCVFPKRSKKLIIDVASAPSHPPLTNGLYSKRQLLKGLDYFYLKFATSFITLYQFHCENQVGVSPGPSVSLFPPPPCCITFLIRVLYDFCRKTKTEVHNSHSECRKIPEPMS